MGFSVPHGLRRERWSLTPPFHPYRSPCKHELRRYILCGTVRQDASRHHFPHISPSEPLEVTRHRALRCSDFPPPPGCPERSDSPPSQNQFSIAPPLCWNNSDRRGLARAVRRPAAQQKRGGRAPWDLMVRRTEPGAAHRNVPDYSVTARSISWL